MCGAWAKVSDTTNIQIRLGTCACALHNGWTRRWHQLHRLGLLCSGSGLLCSGLLCCGLPCIGSGLCSGSMPNVGGSGSGNVGLMCSGMLYSGLLCDGTRRGSGNNVGRRGLGGLRLLLH